MKKGITLIIVMIFFTSCLRSPADVKTASSDMKETITAVTTVYETSVVTSSEAETTTEVTKEFTYDWQRAYAELFTNEYESLIYTASTLYIDDINGDGVPEVMPVGGLYYYNNGVICGGAGYYKITPYYYLPKTNQILVYTSGTGGYLTTYSWDNFEQGDTISSWDVDEYGNQISAKEFFSIYDDLISSAYEYKPLRIEDFDGSWEEYINEKLFY